MRYLAILITAACFLGRFEPAVAESSSQVSLKPYLSAESVSESWSEASSHLVVLGALEKVDHELQPEDSEIISGRKFQETFYLPEARRTGQVFEHYLQQLEALGEIKFQCDGRGCGSSSYWANRVFDRAILYGPEQYQKYAVVNRHDGQGYIAVYVGERATRKIYVHLVNFLQED